MSQFWIQAELVVTQPEKLQQTQTELLKLQELTLQEAGCIQFSVCQVKGDPYRFNLWESWVDENAFALHMQASYTQGYFAQNLTEVATSQRLIPLTVKCTELMESAC
ncbi:putative quinol monooxygenase [Catenovulum sp. SX2]|uniref:putative quinol monooxygenase n=1 Tax=Catenovulum sp. SX2 TaxID=3398614 RepID=UPI003F82DD72